MKTLLILSLILSATLLIRAAAGEVLPLLYSRNQNLFYSSALQPRFNQCTLNMSEASFKILFSPMFNSPVLLLSPSSSN